MQRKSYLYVRDCIDAILIAVERSVERVNIFNLGADEYIDVNQSVGWITEILKLRPKINYTGGTRGWVGDSPFIFLDTGKIRGLGWRPKVSIRDGISLTLEYLRENKWLLEARK